MKMDPSAYVYVLEVNSTKIDVQVSSFTCLGDVACSCIAGFVGKNAYTLHGQGKLFKSSLSFLVGFYHIAKTLVYTTSDHVSDSR